MSIIPDCLVLKIEEIDDSIKYNDIDSTIYIIYDVHEKLFIVRGKRRSTQEINSQPYSFTCNSAHDLADFLSVVICKRNLRSYTLLNYDNLPDNHTDITYSYLEQYDEPAYEICGYDYCRHSKKKLLEFLRMLRNVYNNYYEL
jgi:hypothetical protein